jgi:hypothetical protein
METANLPKFNWGELSELNSGHTPNEWGMQKKSEKKQKKYVAYDVVWNS